MPFMMDQEFEQRYFSRVVRCRAGGATTPRASRLPTSVFTVEIDVLAAGSVSKPALKMPLRSPRKD